MARWAVSLEAKLEKRQRDESRATLGRPQGLLLGLLTWSSKGIEKWGILPEPLSASGWVTCLSWSSCWVTATVLVKPLPSTSGLQALGFPTAAVPNPHKRNGLKQHQFVILQGVVFFFF